MVEPIPDQTLTVIKRIFLVQVSLIVVSTVLFLSAIRIDIGFFWFAFLGGMFGASLALQRQVQLGDAELVRRTCMSWYLSLMPFLYGGMMGAVTYFLFASGILSGQSGNGLLATNLFPDFSFPGQPASPDSPPAAQVAVKDWLRLRPTELHDAGKLMIWCFLGGYSESFVTGILGRLEADGSKE